MKHYHVIVWIDHKEARIYSLNWQDSVSEWRIHDHEHGVRVHHKAGVHAGSGKAHEDDHYYHEAAAAIADAGEILVTGPGTAKLEFFRHLNHHDPKVAAKVVGVETLDHPSEGELVAYARKTFKAIDQSLPQR